MVSFFNCGLKRDLDWARIAIIQKRQQQTEQITNSDDDSPFGTFRDEPGHQEADNAPERAYHDERDGEAGIRHVAVGGANLCPATLLCSHLGLYFFFCVESFSGFGVRVIVAS